MVVATVRTQWKWIGEFGAPIDSGDLWPQVDVHLWAGGCLERSLSWFCWLPGCRLDPGFLTSAYGRIDVTYTARMFEQYAQQFYDVAEKFRNSVILDEIQDDPIERTVRYPPAFEIENPRHIEPTVSVTIRRPVTLLSTRPIRAP